ncbi:MAG TPA: hypothetical protein VGI39_39745 [Polyangiaceae bacterium]|jgi:hypothetical protein
MGTLTNNAMRSTDVRLRFFAAGMKEFITDTMDFSVKENATESEDQINGADAADPYSVFNFWDIDFNGRQKDNQFMTDFLTNIASRRAGTGETPGVVTVEARRKDGVTNVYTFSGVTRKAMSMNVSGRADPFKLAGGWKCVNFTQIQ